MIEVYLFNLIPGKEGVMPGTGDEIIIKVSGHAGFAENKADIVCAAASAIVQTAVLSINKVLKLRQKVRQKKGFLETRINIIKKDNIKLNNLLVVINTMIVGLDEIRKEYPESIRINYN